MRTYGRITNADGSKSWVEVTTDASGNNDFVWLVTLIQCLLLNRGESPFYADHGIPSQQAVIQQIFPDFYVTLTQQQFAPYFASLSVTKISGTSPAYRISLTTQQGVSATEYVPVPQ